MTVLHPMSTMEVAFLASKLLADGSWTDDATNAEAREITLYMENSPKPAPREDSPAARVLDAKARRLSALAKAAYEAHGLLYDGRDMSWLTDPVIMDEMARASFVY